MGRKKINKSLIQQVKESLDSKFTIGQNKYAANLLAYPLRQVIMQPFQAAALKKSEYTIALASLPIFLQKAIASTIKMETWWIRLQC